MDQPPSSSKAHVQREGPSDGYGGNSCSGAANSAAEVVPAAPSVANSSAAAKARVTRFDPYDWAANQYTKSSGAAYDARQRMAKFVQEMKKSKADDSTSSSALSEGFVSSKVAAAPQSKPTKRAGGHCGSAPSAKQQRSLESTAEGQVVPPAPSVSNSTAAAKARVSRFDPYNWAANQYTATSGAANDARQRMAKFVQEMKKSKAGDSTCTGTLGCTTPASEARSRLHGAAKATGNLPPTTFSHDRADGRADPAPDPDDLPATILGLAGYTIRFTTSSTLIWLIYLHVDAYDEFISTIRLWPVINPIV